MRTGRDLSHWAPCAVCQQAGPRCLNFEENVMFRATIRRVALLCVLVSGSAWADTTLLNVSYDVTRDFYKDFANSLSLLDEVILCDIYPAREQPIPGVTSKLIYDNLKPGVEKSMIHKEDVLDLVKSRNFDVLVVLGAGDLDNYVPEITKILESK